MTNDTDYREQMRAVFLAAIMVVSMVAAGAAFAGTAAAATEDPSNIQFSQSGESELALNVSGNAVSTDISFDIAAIFNGTPSADDQANITISDTGSLDFTSAGAVSFGDGNEVSINDTTAGDDIEIQLNSTGNQANIGSVTVQDVVIDTTGEGGTSQSVNVAVDYSVGPGAAGTIGTNRDADIGTIDVLAASSDVTIDGFSGAPSQVERGDSYDVDATVTNKLDTSISSEDIYYLVRNQTGTVFADNGGTNVQWENASASFDLTPGQQTVTITNNQVPLGQAQQSYAQAVVTDGSEVENTNIAVVSSASGTANLEYQFNGSVVYQGQDVYVTGDDIDKSGSYSLRSVDAFDGGSVDASSNVEELKVIDSSEVNNELTSGAINKFGLGGEDVILIETGDYEASDFYVAGQNGAGDNLPSDGSLAREGTFEVSVQAVTAELADDDQPALTDDLADSQVELDYGSGRDGFTTNVSANGDLDDEDLFNLFGYNTLVNESRSNNTANAFLGSITRIKEDGTIVYNGGNDETDSALEFLRSTNSDVRSNHTVALDDETNYDINALNDGLRFGQFNVQFYDSSADDFDEKILLRTTGEIDEQDISTIGLDEGEYELTFDVLDTEAETTETLEVDERNLDAEFEDGVTQDTAGDITSFTVSLTDNDEAWVQIGGESSDFVDVLYLEADDASESMTVDVNTRLLGSSASIDAVYDEGDNVDTIESEMHGGVSTQPATSLYGDDGALGSDFEAYLEAMEIINTNTGETRADQLIRPLQSTDYEIRVGAPDADTQVFDADDGGEAEDELASKTLELQQPAIGEITTHTAPEDDADALTNVSEIVDAATPREEIAADDRLIVQVEATGIYGAILAGPDGSAGTSTADNPDFDRLTDGVSSEVLYDVTELASEQVTFEVVADANTGNQDALEVNLESASDSDTYVVLDEDSGQFFLVVDTSSDNSFSNGDAPDEATDFTVNMEYDADNEDDRYEFNDATENPFSFKSGTHQNYPYLQQGETLSNSAELTVAPRSVDYDNINEDEVVQAENTAGSVISGATNVAPGSEVSLRVQSTDASSSFRQGNDINITDDGSFETQFDLSGQEVGDQFDTNFRVEGSSTDSADSVIVEEGTLSTAEPADDGEQEEPADDGEQEEPADDGEQEEPADDGEEPADDGSTDDGTPGFGAVVALIALIGAALLAVRRQD